MENGFKVISGWSNDQLVDDVCTYLSKFLHLNTEPVDIKLGNFSDGETRVEIKENLRGYHVFVIQSLSNPVNDNLMELCFILDALKRASVSQVTVILPYYGYARQDRKVLPRVPISAKVVADIIQTCGLDRLVTIDLHANQIQGFFNCPVDNLYASSILLNHMDIDKDTVIVSPDKGGTELAMYYAQKLNCELAFCYKHREKPNEVAEMKLIGNVKNKNCILVDDMIDTAGTLVKAGRLLKQYGAKDIEVYATHGIFSGPSIDRLENSEISQINITNTIQLPSQILTSPKFNVINVDMLIAEAIKRIYNKESLSELFI